VKFQNEKFNRIILMREN